MNSSASSSSSSSAATAAATAAPTMSTTTTTALSCVQVTESVEDFIKAECVRRAALGEEEIFIEWVENVAEECAPIDDEEEDDFDGASMQAHDGSVDGVDDAPFLHTRSKDILPNWA